MFSTVHLEQNWKIPPKNPILEETGQDSTLFSFNNTTIVLSHVIFFRNSHCSSCCGQSKNAIRKADSKSDDFIQNECKNMHRKICDVFL